VPCDDLPARLPRLLWAPACPALMHRCTSSARHIPLTLAQDIITDDEIISDSYDLKLIDGVVYEADCKKITVGGETFGMPCPAKHRPPRRGALTRRRHRCQRLC